MKEQTLFADDGTPLAARFFEPAAGAERRAAVVIGGAMGVRQDYYRDFASWLAGQGFVVATFDYRGSGDSRPSSGTLRGFRADLFDWARDTDTVIDALAARSTGLPICLVGHSLGAQLPGLLRHT